MRGKMSKSLKIKCIARYLMKSSRCRFIRMCILSSNILNTALRNLSGQLFFCWICRLRRISNSCRITCKFTYIRHYFLRQLFKGENYLRKYCVLNALIDCSDKERGNNKQDLKMTKVGDKVDWSWTPRLTLTERPPTRLLTWFVTQNLWGM